MYIPQIQLAVLNKKCTKGKVIVVYGPRRVGKTTLLKHFLKDKTNYLFVSGEDLAYQEVLSSQRIDVFDEFIGSHSLLVIDEAQYIPHIGLNLKLIVDHFPHLKIVVSGSSSFDLANDLGEPLTGRKYELQLFTLSQIELDQVNRRCTSLQQQKQLETHLIFGSYPEVVLLKTVQEKREYLHELVNGYLYKDILQIEGIKKGRILVKLLQLLAHQIGKEVSFSELGTQLGINRATVERYLDILEKVFVIVSLRGFSRNLRKEITKSARYYFFDVGIRNTLIQNFNQLSIRNDAGELWENFLIMERIKKQHYLSLYANNYFWRTHDQKEIDWVEEREGALFAYEFKYGDADAKAPRLWKETYPDSAFQVVNRTNYLSFIT